MLLICMSIAGTVPLLCLLAICLHFYNPLTLLTLLLYTSFSENIADQAATEGFTTEERKAYAVALVNLSARNRQVPVVWKNNLLGTCLLYTSDAADEL